MKRIITAIVLGAALTAPGAVAFAKPKGLAHNAIADGVGDTTASYGKLAKYTNIIDVDMRISKNNVPVGMHDRSIATTTHGKGYVDKMTWAQLKKVKTDDGGHIPSLRWLAGKSKSTGKWLHVEMKVTPNAKQWVVINRILKPIKSHVIIDSINLARVDKIKYGYKKAWIPFSKPMPSVKTILKHHLSFIWGPIWVYSPASLATLKAKGVRFITSCGVSTACWERGTRLGVWAFATDNIKAYVAWKP